MLLHAVGVRLRIGHAWLGYVYVYVDGSVRVRGKDRA